MVNKGDDLIDLPPGFRFHPTDEEIITHYLTEKVMNSSFCASAIGEVDLNKVEPWDLPSEFFIFLPTLSFFRVNIKTPPLLLFNLGFVHFNLLLNFRSKC